MNAADTSFLVLFVISRQVSYFHLTTAFLTEDAKNLKLSTFHTDLFIFLRFFTNHVIGVNGAYLYCSYVTCPKTYTLPYVRFTS
jgi:hypothetical protein